MTLRNIDNDFKKYRQRRQEMSTVTSKRRQRYLGLSAKTLRKVDNYFAERRNVIMNCRRWRQKVSNDVKMSLTTLKTSIRSLKTSILALKNGGIGIKKSDRNIKNYLKCNSDFMLRRSIMTFRILKTTLKRQK
jgi:hypothetical protein